MRAMNGRRWLVADWDFEIISAAIDIKPHPSIISTTLIIINL